MNHSNPTGFGQFVPGFEFLQKLAQGAATPGPMAGWLAPTLDPQALDKRIEELKAVQFWLDQNATALKATIQALEVQKMTLATLGSMNVNLAELAAKAQPPAAPPARDATPAAPKGPAKEAAQPAAKSAAKPAAAITPDPMQYWGALTRQFQQIAATALQDVAQRSAAAPATVKAAAASRKAPAPAPAAPARPAAKKTAARPRSRKPAP